LFAPVFCPKIKETHCDFRKIFKTFKGTKIYFGASYARHKQKAITSKAIKRILASAPFLLKLPLLPPGHS
jgi:hypothetical protein